MLLCGYLWSFSQNESCDARPPETEMKNTESDGGHNTGPAQKQPKKHPPSSLFRGVCLSITLNSNSIAVTVSPGGGWVSFWMWAYRFRAGTSVLPQVAASSKASWMKMYWSSVWTM